MKNPKTMAVYRVDTELYPDSPLLEVSETWIKLEGAWLNPGLEQVDPKPYQDHLYFSKRIPALQAVEAQVAANEKEWQQATAKYHKRLWQLASVLMTDVE